MRPGTNAAGGNSTTGSTQCGCQVLAHRMTLGLAKAAAAARALILRLKQEIAAHEIDGYCDVNGKIRRSISVGIDLDEICRRIVAELARVAAKNSAADKGEMLPRAKGIRRHATEIDLIVLAMTEAVDSVGIVGQAVGHTLEDELVGAGIAEQLVDA